MSEAMTNSEIEDVLSSVRRLVAQEGRRAEPGRLILTQAQRVRPETDSSGSATSEVSPPESEPHAGLPPPDFRELEATIAELEAAVCASDSAWEADETAGTGAGQHDAPSNVTELYGKMSFVRRAMQARREAQEPPAAAPMIAANHDQPALRASSGEPAEAAPPLATQEHAIDHTRTASIAEPGAEVTPGSFEDEIEEAIIDEEMLRDLVSQLVRDELQGQLGERITLLVRKLVRAEIAKALDERKLL
ncbi:MAG: hypothetical protein ACK4LQ_00440 [Pararhodobacter sp.]